MNETTLDTELKGPPLYDYHFKESILVDLAANDGAAFPL